MPAHNIFISWSGERSQIMAKAIHDWIQLVIQAANPFMSTIDIEAGTRSGLEIAKQLESIRVGLICITPENQHAPWLNFEAGALSKHLDDSRVAPIILDMRKSDVEKPLGDFDANSIEDRTSMLEVASMVNMAIVGGLDDKKLERVFAMYWDGFQDDLRARLTSMVPTQAGVPKRTEADMVSEILETVRGLSAEIAALRSTERRGSPIELSSAHRERRLRAIAEHNSRIVERAKVLDGVDLHREIQAVLRDLNVPDQNNDTLRDIERAVMTGLLTYPMVHEDVELFISVIDPIESARKRQTKKSVSTPISEEQQGDSDEHVMEE